MINKPVKLAAFAALALAIPAAVVLAQAPNRGGPDRDRPGRASPETMERLHDGRMAMIRESLRLNESQQKLWGPVEEQLRAGFSDRLKSRADRRRDRETRSQLSMSERLDRASERAAKRAERTKALADAFRPFYASLSDEQKAVAEVVLRQGGRGERSHGRYGRRWGMMQDRSVPEAR